MEFELTPSADRDDDNPPVTNEDSSFQISSRPIVARGEAQPAAGDFLPLPRSYGTETLSLLARDPHTIFAFWDIDWTSAFRYLAAKEHPVHLRLLDSDGIEQSVTEVEPMAGSCYVTVDRADAAYRGEIGFFHPANQWTCLASSALITTPPNDFTEDRAADFATVPSHLSFQRMLDSFAVNQRESASLTTMLADLRERVSSSETCAELTPEQTELARVVETLRASAGPALASRSPDPRLQKKLERILGFGSSSPAGGFGGSSRSF